VQNGNGDASWSFLTNHGLALLVVAHDPGARMRDIADAIGVTERTAQRIVADLIAAGYVLRTRPGRRNRYAIRADVPVRLPLERDVKLGELLAVLGAENPDRQAARSSTRR
jgi:DNA-binding Lrp family transcriptional regulator